MNARYLYLEGLRGILAIIVVIHHFVLLFMPQLYIGSYDLSDFKAHAYSTNMLLANTPLNIFMNGNWAVCMFFTLSGFVLSSKYLRTNNIFVLQESIAKRYFRITIPVLCACLFVFILHFSGVFKNTMYPRSVEIYSFGKDLFLNNLSFLNTLKMALFNVPLNGDNTYLPILWTMEVEFLGALLLFVFLLSAHRLKNKLVFYLILICILFLMDKNYILLFFAGSLICLYEEEIKKIFNKTYLKIVLLLLALYFSGIPNIQNEAKKYTLYAFTNNFPPLVYLYFHIISCVLFFIFFIGTEIPKKIFSNRVLIFLGKISFGMYLVHLPILFVSGSYFLNKTKGQMNQLLLFVICFSITLIISSVFYYLIDSKAVLFTNKFVKRFIKTN